MPRTADIAAMIAQPSPPPRPMPALVDDACVHDAVRHTAHAATVSTPPLCPPLLASASESPSRASSATTATTSLKLNLRDTSSCGTTALSSEGETVSDDMLAQWLVDMVSACKNMEDEAASADAGMLAATERVGTPRSSGKQRLVFHLHPGSMGHPTTPGNPSRAMSVPRSADADGGQSVAVRVAGQVIATPTSSASERKRLFAGTPMGVGMRLVDRLSATPSAEAAVATAIPGFPAILRAGSGGNTMHPVPLRHTDSTGSAASLPPLIPDLIAAAATVASPATSCPTPFRSPPALCADPATATPGTALSGKVPLASPPGLCLDTTSAIASPPGLCADDADMSAVGIASPVAGLGESPSPPGLCVDPDALDDDADIAMRSPLGSTPNRSPPCLYADDDHAATPDAAATTVVPPLDIDTTVASAAGAGDALESPASSPPGLEAMEGEVMSPDACVVASSEAPGVMGRGRVQLMMPGGEGAVVDADEDLLCGSEERASATPQRSPPGLCADTTITTLGGAAGSPAISGTSTPPRSPPALFAPDDDDDDDEIVAHNGLPTATIATPAVSSVHASPPGLCAVADGDDDGDVDATPTACPPLLLSDSMSVHAEMDAADDDDDDDVLLPELCQLPQRTPTCRGVVGDASPSPARVVEADDTESVLSVDFRSRMKRSTSTAAASPEGSSCCAPSRGSSGSGMNAAASPAAATPLPVMPSLCEVSASPAHLTPPPLLPCPATPSPAPKVKKTNSYRDAVCVVRGDDMWSLRN